MSPADAITVIGEMLVDQFDTGPVVGGAPFNVARHLAAFGHGPMMVSAIGADATPRRDGDRPARGHSLRVAQARSPDRHRRRGDAFSAVVLTGCLRGWDMHTTLERATEFAGRICEVRGAVPANLGSYAAWTAAWRTGTERC